MEFSTDTENTSNETSSNNTLNESSNYLIEIKTVSNSCF